MLYLEETKVNGREKKSVHPIKEHGRRGWTPHTWYIKV
jgi:hypothetical protein